MQPHGKRGPRAPLTTGGHIGAAEICDSRNPGALGNDCRISDLQGKRMRSLRPVAHGLAVGADCPHVAGGNPGTGKQTRCRFREAPANGDIEGTKFVERDGRIRCGQGQQAGTDWRWIGKSLGGDDLHREWRIVRQR